MTTRSALHATFTIARDFGAPPARVFRAFADPAAKLRWFGTSPDYVSEEFVMDFRVGGRDVARGRWHGGTVHDFALCYQDIVEDERIVFCYDMHLDGRRISVSLTTLEFRPHGNGTTLVLTEQGVFLDGYDDPAGRERGTRELLDALDAEIRRDNG